MAPPRPPLPLIHDVMVEIFLRLPPDEPEHLFRAALVCKPWLRILCDPGFLRRYRAFHGAPPLLGLLHRLKVMQGDPEPRLTPTTAAPLSPYPDRGRSRALDCRHGRVLLHVGADCWHFVVWDPVTGDEHRLEEPGIPWLIYSGAVLCAVPGCDHLDCHGGPFRVVFVVTDDHEELVKATVYSSETGAWSSPVTLDSGCESYAKHRRDALADSGFYYIPYVQPRRGAVIGDEAYFTLRWGNAIVKYDWGNNSISLINPPTQHVYHVALMVMEDSSLGFACVQDSSLYLWSRKVNSEQTAEWVQCRSIELEEIIPVIRPDDKPLVVGCAEGMDAIFVSTGAGLFTIRLHSKLVKKVEGSGVYFSVLPYMSFYTPDHGRLLSLGGLTDL
ncbi:uncharacterized protein LOC8080520 [Sorghum bicolor]|uniref:Uncharacterized protein n=1 Tax=Sorghum bicolor TaxID=4558 RepID=C5XLT4_SORBI|nr:uncharacterized protein LOC8080520 [Sorghum bicolor]EES00116.1 hypothetical protein SORBI_3003G028400 [Sorghum bicolor]|eukprot:XP_002454996.1 uncharacterized protein LOC8080520 [Sorghum bicolor]